MDQWGISCDMWHVMTCSSETNHVDVDHPSIPDFFVDPWAPKWMDVGGRRFQIELLFVDISIIVYIYVYMIYTHELIELSNVWEPCNMCIMYLYAYRQNICMLIYIYSSIIINQYLFITTNLYSKHHETVLNIIQQYRGLTILFVHKHYICLSSIYYTQQYMMIYIYI